MRTATKLLAAAFAALPFIALAQSPAIKPGLWDVAVTIAAMDMENPPPGFAAAIGSTTHSEVCVTPAVAAQGPQAVIKPQAACNFDNARVNGSAFSFDMACKQGGSTMTSVGSGRYAPDGFTVTSRANMAGDLPMTMTSTTVGKRLGDCR